MSKMFILDLRSLALFRIGLGALILWDIADRSRFLEDFWGPHGIYSLECAALNSPPLLSLYYSSPSVAYHAFYFSLTALAAAFLVVGRFTRTATVCAFILVLGLHLRGAMIIDVGDHLLRFLLFWGIFLPLGQRLSLDAPAELTNRHVSVASAGAMLQVALVFLGAGIAKLSGEHWLNGEAVAMALAGDTWVRPAGLWLYRFPTLTSFLNWATMAVECVAPLLLFARATRVPALLALAGFAASLGIAINLGLIPWVLLLGLVLFLPSGLWGDEEPIFLKASTWTRAPATAALAVMLGLSIRAWFGMPFGRVDNFFYQVLLIQNWSMYVPPYQENFQLVFRGKGMELPIGAERSGWPAREPWEPLERLWGNYRTRVYLYDSVSYPGDVELAYLGTWFARRHPAEDVELVKVVRRPWSPQELGAVPFSERPVQPLLREMALWSSDDPASRD